MSKLRHYKKGGKVSEGRTKMWVSGNPDVRKEAKGEEPYDKGDEAKHGGRIKHKRATGGKVMGLMTGGGVRPRLDRPGRKRGGGVGADRSPLSSAHGKSSAEPLPREQGGD